MNEPLGKQITGETPSAPWLALTEWLPWPGGKLGHPTHQVHEIHPGGNFSMAERQLRTAAMHLAISIRMYGIDEESEAMLALLERLFAAGEIQHEEYFRRVENLFPQQVALLDQGLKQKILAILV